MDTYNQDKLGLLLLGRHDFQVSTVPSQEEWTGLTNPDDLELVRNKINNLRS